MDSATIISLIGIALVIIGWIGAYFYRKGRRRKSAFEVVWKHASQLSSYEVMHHRAEEVVAYVPLLHAWWRRGGVDHLAGVHLAAVAPPLLILLDIPHIRFALGTRGQGIHLVPKK